MSKRFAASVGLAMLVALTGLVAAAPSPELVDLLGGIDFVPSHEEIDSEVDGVLDIVEIVNDTAADEGLRIRAIRALGTYDADPDRQVSGPSLVAVINQFSNPAGTGINTVYLRAAMESLALVQGPNGIDSIIPQLLHNSRDVRASAAKALQLAGSQGACNALREANLVVDEVEQVEFALSEAIRELCEQ